ncbi:MAG: elongation factor G [Alphaproteobacteria bacterium]
MSKHKQFAPRSVALVGPYSSGKTTLAESMLHHAGEIDRQGKVSSGNTIGDSSKEARARQMSTEPNFLHYRYIEDDWSLVDCPGSVELLQDSFNIIPAMDVVVVVAEPEPHKAVILEPILHNLQENNIPHIIFINKMDIAENSVRSTFDALQEVSRVPLLLRAIPMRDGDEVTGLIDLVSERAWRFNEGATSSLTKIPDDVIDREEIERGEMLESVADFDDALLEALLEDIKPEAENIYQDLTDILQNAQAVPVFFGSAENGWGVTRLLKALRHETDEGEKAEVRLNIGSKAFAVLKNIHTQQGKLTVSRILGGDIKEGETLGDFKLGSIVKLQGTKAEKTDIAPKGSIVAFGRLDDINAGQIASADGVKDMPGATILAPLYNLAIHVDKKADEVKLTAALSKLVEEDDALIWDADPVMNQILLKGQGENHLKIAIDRLANKFGVNVGVSAPKVAYKETIRKPAQRQARYKKQSGGHGQFADVQIEIKPQARGEGFIFTETIHGGSVPKQYIPAVETGAKEFMKQGNLGFPVVDVAVNLSDGKHHDVDSSELAFKLATIMALREGMNECSPILLEPIMHVELLMPSQYASGAQSVVSGRRGQILGFTPIEGRDGWDEIVAHIPEASMGDMINEIRSLTQGIGSFTARYDHLQELSGREADAIVEARLEELKS